MPAFAAAFFFQMDTGYLHALVYGLAHVVDGEEGGADGGEGQRMAEGDEV